MAELSEKELSAINDCLKEEELLVKKFKMLAEHAEDDKVKNCFKEPVCDAVVKLVEIVCKDGKEERRPVGHTFTDKDGEFVFGPLCPGREYAVQIWVNDTKKIKICAKCHHEGKCLKGDKHDKCDCFIGKNDGHSDDRNCEDSKECCDK